MIAERSASFRIASLLALLLLIIVPLRVSAHVALVAATPLPDSTIGRPPRAIIVRFDQEPEPGFDAITLLDTAGHTIAGGSATRVPDDPTAITVTIGSLPPGIYTVAWQALAPDGHLTKGNYAFTLSAAPGPAAPAAPEPVVVSPTSALPSSVTVGTGNPSAAAVIVHWVRYVALGLVVGAFGLAALVLFPALVAVEADDAHRFRAMCLLRGWAFAGVGLFLFAHIATLIAEAASDSDRSMTAVSGGAIRRVLLDTVYGGVWRVIAALAFVLLVGLVVSLRAPMRLPASSATLGIVAGIPKHGTDAPIASRPCRWSWWLGLGAALLLACALTFSSHAIESQHQPVLALLTDAAHLAAMGLWLGGLFILLPTLPTLPRLLRPLDAQPRTDLLVATIRRFSMLGFAAVAALIATGLYTMTLHTTRTTILSTSHG